MKALFYLSLLFFSTFAHATFIDWYCVPHSSNLTSDGQAMGSDFIFELGVFTNGFVPTPENMDQWAANWVSAQRAVYNEENGWFTSRFSVVSNTSPFRAGTQAWIWGFAGSPENGEWILFRNTAWKWPRPSPRNPISMNWKASEADTILVGGVGGSAVLRSQSVPNAVPPETNWEQWRQQYLGVLADTEGLDVNGNGIPDILEYILGAKDAEDLLASRITIRQVKEGETVYTELVVPRRADRPAIFDIEMSLNLQEWLPANSVVQLVESQPGYLVYRDQSGAASLDGPWFWRYKVTVQE